MENSLLRGSYEQKTLYSLLALDLLKKDLRFYMLQAIFFSCLLSFTSLCTHGEPGMRVPNGPGKRRKIYKRWSSFKTLDSFRLPAPKTINRNAWQERKGDSSLHVWVLLSRREEAGACEGFLHKPGSFPLCQNSVTLWESRHRGRTQSWKLLLQRLLLTW